MEFKERLSLHRAKLEQSVDVDKLCPLLVQDKALSQEEVLQVQAVVSKSGKVGKLLDILLTKDSSALQSFHLVLQKMYQHVLTAMFYEPHFTSKARPQHQESCSTSLTSDSEEDASQGQITADVRPHDYGGAGVSRGGGKLTKRIPSQQQYEDPNSTMSSSYPAFSDHLSPLSLSMESPSQQDKGYDWFFKQFEHAFTELRVLKQQNAQMMGLRDRYDQVSKEAEHLRKVSKSQAQCLQQVSSELHSVKNHQAEVLTEKQQLLEELSTLHQLRQEDKHQLAGLRQHHRKTGSSESGGGGGSGDGDSLDTDLLREQYAQLSSSHSTVLARLESMTDEKSKQGVQLEELHKKYEALVAENTGLKQQCTDVIRKWNQDLIRHNQVKETLSMVKQQRDELCKDVNQSFSRHAELKKSFEALRAEKDAAIKEYALVMSERDTVHKEMEQLQEKVSVRSKQVEVVELEKQSLQADLDTLRHDMAAVLADRDKYRRERNDISGRNQDLKHECLEFELRLEHQRDLTRKECSEAYVQMEQMIKASYTQSHQEMESRLVQISKDSEALQKQAEKLKHDLESAEQEAENANKNRDKAFSERDKIVQERESMRTLCDNLRRDRDRAVSDLAQALRDSDEFKRQKNEAVKELKEIKSRYEAMVEKDSRRQTLQYGGHNHSRDSAIDADLQDLGAESQEVLMQLNLSEPGDVGFELMSGGREETDHALVVTHVVKGSPAEGKLRVNDTLLRINNVEMTGLDRHSALEMLWACAGSVSLLVRRRKSTTPRVWQPVQVVLSWHREVGIQLEQGLYISSVTPGAVLAKYGLLPCVGDRILTVNSIPVERLSLSEAMRVLEKSSGAESVVLEVLRQTSPLNSAGSSPTPTSPLTTMSGVMSKSDSLAIQATESWDGGTGGSSKNLRSSGSQTDSLDSPGPSPRKALRNGPDQDKARHSMPMLDKAKEKVERILRSRHKSQEREKEVVEEKKEENKLVEDCGTQANLASTENVIAEFPTTPVFTKLSPPPSEQSKASRKRELEVDSGTWPKTRGGQSGMSGPPTVVFAPGYKPIKERPSIRDVFYPRPEVRHGSQHSDSSLQSSQGPKSTGAVLTSGSSAFSPPTQPVVSSPNIPAKAQSYFNVGFMHGPPGATAPSTRGGPPPPPMVYGTVPGPHKAPAAAALPFESANVHPRAKANQVKSRRPMSTPQRPDKAYWPPAGSRIISESPIHGSKPQGRNPVLAASYSYRPASLEVPFKMCEVSGEGTTPRVRSPVGSAVRRVPHYGHPPPIGEVEPSDRPLSYHGGPLDRYSTPSPPAHKSYSTYVDRLTPTINEEMVSSRFNRFSPRDEELALRQAIGRRDKVLERIRIPSNTSVNTYSGSVEIVSDRSSPGSPLFHIDYRGSLKCSPTSDENIYRRKLPSHHETRAIFFEKSSKPMGFQIQRGPLGGIFVSSVNDHSLAAQAGLVIGDQLLEVCGINMRNANYEHAVTVLRQCGDTVTMKVQYNPEKYTDPQLSSSTSLSSSSYMASPLSLNTTRTTHMGEVVPEGRRFMTLKKSNPNMMGPGFSFIGGNAVGIFVHAVDANCFVGGAPPLQPGDHILEFNSVDFRSVTAEKAMMELNRPCATMTLCVCHNFTKYSKVQNMANCDSFYIRANFERSGGEGEEELSFHREDILHVEDSIHQHQLGAWYAWLLDPQGNKVKAGLIPSRIRLEDEIVLRRTHSESWSLHEPDDLKGSRRGQATARRSFFRRRSRHLRNNSKESPELSSLSDASINSDSVPILDDSILGYTQVERIELKSVRPVVVLAPLAEPLCLKLEAESPDKYKYCHPGAMRASVAAMEQSIAEGVLLDYWKEEELFQCVRLTHVQEICDSKVHCLLSVSPVAVERMHAAKIYPITIYVRHKSAKQIRETRDPKFLKERVNSKTAVREQFEHFQRIEQDYPHLFSAVIQGGNLAEMCMQIKTVIAAEEKKALWVSRSPLV